MGFNNQRSPNFFTERTEPQLQIVIKLWPFVFRGCQFPATDSAKPVWCLSALRYWTPETGISNTQSFPYSHTGAYPNQSLDRLHQFLVYSQCSILTLLIQRSIHVTHHANQTMSDLQKMVYQTLSISIVVFQRLQRDDVQNANISQYPPEIFLSRLYLLSILTQQT